MHPPPPRALDSRALNLPLPRRWWHGLWGIGALLTMLAIAAILWAVLRSDSVEVEVAAAQGATPQVPAPFVRSQQGTTPDGDLRTPATATAAGSSTLPYGELRRLFDYYLSAFGEKELSAITAQIQTELDQRLKPIQAQKARRLLDAYIAFKRALVAMEAKPELAGNAVAAIRQRMLAQQDLRTQFFSPPEIEGMFAFDDAYDADAVARLEVSQNAQLSAEQKQKKLAALDAAMPANLRAERQASRVVIQVEQQAADMRANGASDDDVYRMRAKAFDPQAAARLAELDQDEAHWKRRIATYLQARTQLLASLTNASPSERELALAQLQQSQFSQDERRRLAAYED